MEKICTTCMKIKTLDCFNNGNSSMGKESKCRECKKIWRKNNIDYYIKYERSEERKKKHLFREKRRRILKKIQGDGTLGRDLTKKQIEALLQKQNFVCAITGETLIFEGKYKFHTDHIVPLIKGGKHTLDNIQLLTPSANLAKGIKII